MIVVFHRIRGEYVNDALTTSPSDFENFVKFFARYFEALSLSALLDRLEHGDDLGSVVTITFDDGYLGNATIAAPILEKYGLRGCFFIVSDFIGTDYVTWWDQKNGIQTQWMTWADVRSLRAAGHEVGSHTATHVDLGVVVGEEACREIQAGKRRLEAELSEPSDLFAYPYGGRGNFAAENKELPRQLGMRCNASAYGGTVSVGDDPFALKRTSITRWFESPYMFGFELVAGRLEST